MAKLDQPAATITTISSPQNPSYIFCSTFSQHSWISCPATNTFIWNTLL